MRVREGNVGEWGDPYGILSYRPVAVAVPKLPVFEKTWITRCASSDSSIFAYAGRVPATSRAIWKVRVVRTFQNHSNGKNLTEQGGVGFGWRLRT